MLIQLPHKFTPRDYQLELLRAFFEQQIRHFFWLVHRRAGKDKTCLNLMIAAAFQRVGTYLYLFPEYEQARKVIWTGIDGSGMRFIDHIHPSLIKGKPNNQEMSVPLINGSILRVGGSDNYNSWMGTNPVGIVNSEFPLHNPLSRFYFSPILAENGGWEVLQGTPRGKNHAYKVYMNSLNNSEWYSRKLTVDETKREDGLPVITPEIIEQQRILGISDEIIQQEYYCSFDIGNHGAYYTKEIAKAEKEGRICLFPVTQKKVWTFWDLGVGDAQAIWFMQPGDDGLCNMVYYYESNGMGIEHYAEIREQVRQKFGFTYEADYAPHDIENREWESARTRRAIARDHGINFRVIPKQSIQDRLQACRSIFDQCRFHSEHCYQGILALREYMRDWNEIDKIFKTTPKHNWASHGADAFGYFALVWREMFKHPQLNAPRVYQSSF